MIIIKSPPEPMLLALEYKIFRIEDDSIPRNEAISTISISCAMALADILYKYGELTNSRAIAKQIVFAREKSAIITTKDLTNCISLLVSE